MEFMKGLAIGALCLGVFSGLVILKILGWFRPTK